MRFASEAQRQFQEDQARLDRINQMQRPASTPSFTTPSTPSGGDEHEGLYLEEYNEEGDLIEGGGGGAGGGGGEFDLETHLHGWRNRRALRIQAYARRVVAVGYFRKARAAAIIIQSAARSRTARALMMKRRAAAALITRMGKGRLPKKLAQRRRDAATLITKIAKGKVTRKLMVGLAQGWPRPCRMRWGRGRSRWRGRERLAISRRGRAPHVLRARILCLSASRTSRIRPTRAAAVCASSREAWDDAGERGGGGRESMRVCVRGL